MAMEGRSAARKGRGSLDPFRNGFAQTVVSPYCVRHAPAAAVSVVGPPTAITEGSAASC